MTRALSSPAATNEYGCPWLSPYTRLAQRPGAVVARPTIACPALVATSLIV